MFDIVSLAKTAGYAGVSGIIFAESGLLIGFFLPGDSLIFTCGFLASQGILDIKILIPLLFLAAIIGDSVGYSFGFRFGPKIFKKEDSLLFHKDNLLKAQAFFEKHGGKTIILARFIPIIRTFAPILAGVGKMRYAIFAFYNIIGGLLWSVGLLLLGYYLGKAIPDIDKYLLPIILAIIVISVAPNIIHILRDQKMRTQLIESFKKLVLRFFGKRL